MPNETYIKNSVMKALKSLERATFWRHAGGKFGVAGVPDIVGVYKGYPVAFEVKTPERRNQVTENQKRFIQRFNDAGGYAFVVTSLEEVKDCLRNMENISQGDGGY